MKLTIRAVNYVTDKGNQPGLAIHYDEELFADIVSSGVCETHDNSVSAATFLITVIQESIVDMIQRELAERLSEATEVTIWNAPNVETESVRSNG